MIRKVLIMVMILTIVTFTAGCGSNEQGDQNIIQSSSYQQEVDTDDTDKGNGSDLAMRIGDERVEVKWEDNDSVKALFKIADSNELSIEMNSYGGFEQVGDIGSDLPSNDKQTTTAPGDIVLYQGNQMVIFYGSNSWEYTSLGRITDKTPDELEKLLGSDTVTVTLEKSSYSFTGYV